MRRRSFATASSVIALVLASVAACGPTGPGTPSASGTTSPPGTSPASAIPADPPSASSAAPAELVATKVPLQPIGISVPADWAVLDYERLVALVEQLRPIEPKLADEYELRSTEGLSLVESARLPGAFASLDASFFCDDATTAVELLARLRPVDEVDAFEASVVELPAGEVAHASFVRPMRSFGLRYSVYAFLAPMTDCPGSLTLVVRESDPQPGLAEAIASSVTIDSGQGIVTLELRDTVTLPPTELPVTCALGGETGDELAMSSGLRDESMSVGLSVDASGQPTFFQFSNGTVAYFSGKGFEAREAFVPEPGSTREVGAAAFEGILPPDDAAHPLSGRVSWSCRV